MPIDLDFQKRYATTVLELEQLNKDLNKVLHEVQQFCCEVRHHGLLPLKLNTVKYAHLQCFMNPFGVGVASHFVVHLEKMMQ